MKKKSKFQYLLTKKIVCPFSIAHRMIYALSNAGANPNVTNEKGNTPLHEALLQDLIEIKLDIIQVNVFVCEFFVIVD